MSFSSVQEFLQMGGYAFYVWCSYGLSALVLGFVLLTPAIRHRQLRRDLARRERRAEREASR